MAIGYRRQVTPYASWALRIAGFSAALVLSAILLHRFFGMGTPVALNLFVLGYIGATISIILVLSAAVVIWRHDVRGKFASVLALLVAGGLFAWPVSFLPVYFDRPELNDISTDIKVPPRFAALADARSPGANRVDFDRSRAETLQRTAYPDLRPIEVERSSEEAFELALEALRRLGLEIVSERPPDLKTSRPGFIEASDRTLVIGFRDDVVVRVAGDRWRARFDVRSASRYGRHDLGSNAERIRRILQEFLGRVEATVATAEERAQSRRQRRGIRNFKGLKPRSRAKTSAAGKR